MFQKSELVFGNLSSINTILKYGFKELYALILIFYNIVFKIVYNYLSVIHKIWFPQCACFYMGILQSTVIEVFVFKINLSIVFNTIRNILIKLELLNLATKTFEK